MGINFQQKSFFTKTKTKKVKKERGHEDSDKTLSQLLFWRKFELARFGLDVKILLKLIKNEDQVYSFRSSKREVWEFFSDRDRPDLRFWKCCARSSFVCCIAFFGWEMNFEIVEALDDENSCVRSYGTSTQGSSCEA